MIPFGQQWRHPSRVWMAILRWWHGLLDRGLHRHCLPPRRYPVSDVYEDKAKGPVAVTIRSFWDIEFDDIDAIRRRGEAIGDLEMAVEEWIARRANKCAQIYEIRAREQFKEMGLL